MIFPFMVTRTDSKFSEPVDRQPGGMPARWNAAGLAIQLSLPITQILTICNARYINNLKHNKRNVTDGF